MVMLADTDTSIEGVRSLLNVVLQLGGKQSGNNSVCGFLIMKL